MMSQGTLHQMIPVFSIRDQIWITPSTSSRSSLCGWVLISSASTVTQHKKRKHGNNQLGRSRNSTTTCEPDTNLAQLWGDLISWVKMYFCWGLDKISFNDWLGLPRHDLQLLLLSFVCLYTLIILNVVRESIYVCEYFVCRYVLSSHCFGFFTLFDGTRLPCQIDMCQVFAKGVGLSRNADLTTSWGFNHINRWDWLSVAPQNRVLAGKKTWQLNKNFENFSRCSGKFKILNWMLFFGTKCQNANRRSFVLQSSAAKHRFPRWETPGLNPWFQRFCCWGLL